MRTDELPPSDENTQKPLLYLIFAIAGISIAATLFNGLFTYFFNSNGPQDWLSLSLYGIRQFYLWQPATYLFTQNEGSNAISISYLIHLCFNLYVLWFLGNSITERIGNKSFFKLFFISGILSGLSALLVMKLTGSSTIISGPGSAILSLLTFWTMLYNEAEIRLFILIPMQAKWILTAVFAILVLTSLGSIPYLTLYLTGMLVGYIYAIIVYDLKSPFEFLSPFEDFISKRFKQSDNTDGKIIDFETGRTLDDEMFVDSMLAKISKYGEDSLTFNERRRLEAISKRKK